MVTTYYITAWAIQIFVCIGHQQEDAILQNMQRVSSTGCTNQVDIAFRQDISLHLKIWKKEWKKNLGNRTHMVHGICAIPIKPKTQTGWAEKRNTISMKQCWKEYYWIDDLCINLKGNNLFGPPEKEFVLKSWKWQKF